MNETLKEEGGEHYLRSIAIEEYGKLIVKLEKNIVKTNKTIAVCKYNIDRLSDEIQR